MGRKTDAHDLSAAYERVLGQTLTEIAWRPITSDTPDLVATLGQERLEYSGAASLFFRNREEVFLTWEQCVSGYAIVASNPQEWRPLSLDLINASREFPWSQFFGATLQGASLFRTPRSGGEVLAIRHRFEETSEALWIGVGHNGEVDDHDDLIISVGPPKNVDKLDLIKDI